MEAEHRVWIMFCTRSSIFLWIGESFPFWVFPNLTANSMRSKKGSVRVEHQSTFWQETLYTQLDGNLNHDPFPKREGCFHAFRKTIAFEVRFWKPMLSLLLFRQLQVPDEHSTHLLCLGAFAFLVGLLRDSGSLVTLCSQNTGTSSIGTEWWRCSVGGNSRSQQARAAFLKGKN